ncbi:MAG: TetR/AcrR family transcriptional regulator [Eubacteriales bacterium]|nr:TetR/AcrR family transcriptional regulator [Eubacteriales bacterium]
MTRDCELTTKERIVDEALTLFAVKGFNGTSVKNIAEAVGIKDSSLYKHFKSKKEIMDTIIRQMRSRMEDMSNAMGLPDEQNYTAAAKAYGDLDLKGLITLSKKVLQFYLNDSYVSRFWRLATIEQYQNEEIYLVYRKIFMEESITYQTILFREMIRANIFVDADPEVMAMNFYTPIFFLLSKYMQQPEKEEEALKILERQITEFSRIYQRNV